MIREPGFSVAPKTALRNVSSAAVSREMIHEATGLQPGGAIARLRVASCDSAVMDSLPVLVLCL
jgi:hypothetical protein